MADMSGQRPVTRFSLDLWISLFCRSMGAPIPMLQAHAVNQTMCSCKKFSLDPKGDHVLACKKPPQPPAVFAAAAAALTRSLLDPAGPVTSSHKKDRAAA